jgi:hypothetical protein
MRSWRFESERAGFFALKIELEPARNKNVIELSALRFGAALSGSKI